MASGLGKIGEWTSEAASCSPGAGRSSMSRLLAGWQLGRGGEERRGEEGGSRLPARKKRENLSGLR
jgi:hypothetical protein